MSDEKTRQLERAAAQGDEQAAARLAEERRRGGELTSGEEQDQPERMETADEAVDAAYDGDDETVLEQLEVLREQASGRSTGLSVEEIAGWACVTEEANDRWCVRWDDWVAGTYRAAQRLVRRPMRPGEDEDLGAAVYNLLCDTTPVPTWIQSSPGVGSDPEDLVADAPAGEERETLADWLGVDLDDDDD